MYKSTLRESTKFVGEGTSLNDLHQWKFSSNEEAQRICLLFTEALGIPIILVAFSGHQNEHLYGNYNPRHRYITLHKPGESLATLIHEICHYFSIDHDWQFRDKLQCLAIHARVFVDAYAKGEISC